jgi:type VI secretion system protein ImpL
MQRLWSFLIDPRTLAVIGFAALAAFLFLGAQALQVAAVWAAALLGLAGLTWLGAWLWRRQRERRAAAQFEAALDASAGDAVQQAGKRASPQQQADVKLLRERMRAAIKTLKQSKLGQVSGTQALYALPWYMVIGNPAAGKSTAIVRSGLQFPFAAHESQAALEGSVLQGIGGTRNCDWFFTTEGILLDTAGRYAVHEEDRAEWSGFLQLLKQHRPKAPVNGIIVAVSLAELIGAQPEYVIGLAQQLRQRMQEITEQLAVFAPVYVMFTKADLIGGFAEFFMDRDRESRERVWGATLPYQAPTTGSAHADKHHTDLQHTITQFEQRFDELHEGLKESAIAHMGLHRGEQLPPGVLMFPLEFAALKPALRNFLTTLFEDNPYQFRPIFRGFYFTSAVQQGESANRASERVAQRFGLALRPGDGAAVYSNTGFFLRELFSKVIFADRQLVQQYLSPAKRRLRLAGFLGGVLALGLALSLWTWSYVGNRQFVAHVQADLDQAIKLQDNKLDLASRLQALLLLQDRLAQLQSYRDNHPWSLGLGLYQGDAIEAVVRREYFAGLREVMLKPVAESLEGYLTDVNAHAAQLQPLNTPAPAAALTTAATPYTVAQANDVSDAYNGLKAYLMLADHAHLEAGHLSDQLTRFWRGWLEANRGGMPREEMIRAAEKLISFSLTQMNDPTFPAVANNLTLVDQTRENLRRVVKGMPARERVFAEIKARAATRFGPVTVARIVGEADQGMVAGSVAVSGVFTRAAWDGYVKDAIQTAANQSLQSEDWVLKSTLRDDLTLEGSPEHIQKALTEQYKTEYVAEWRRFMQGVSVNEFGGFDGAVTHMNRLGDPANSPVGKLMQRLYDETSWDNPSLLNERIGQTKRGFVEWFKQTVLGQAPNGITINVNAGENSSGEGGKEVIPMGPIGREFAGVARLMMSREKDPTLMQRYLESLSKIRSRFNQMKNQGDAGPASRALMQATLDGNSSELSDALRLVDEQMLTGMSDSAKAALRPLLVRPLMQSYAVLVSPTEAELNRVWTAQVLQPFNTALAGKYPFDGGSRIEAAPGEIAKVFGAQGSIARFSDQALAGLTVRRGDVLTPRTWADIGIRLRPEFAGSFSGWVAPLAGQGDAAGGGGAGAPAQAADNQTVFQILPQAAPGLTEYTIEIDGQQLRYRNTAAAWTNFVWPSPQGAPGVKISGVSFDGRGVEFINFPGNFGLEKMLGSAARKKLDATTFELKWTSASGANLVVPIKLRIISSPGMNAPAAGQPAGNGSANFKGLQLPTLIAGDDGAPPATASAGQPPTAVAATDAHH